MTLGVGCNLFRLEEGPTYENGRCLTWRLLFMSPSGAWLSFKQLLRDHRDTIRNHSLQWVSKGSRFGFHEDHWLLMARMITRWNQSIQYEIPELCFKIINLNSHGYVVLIDAASNVGKTSIITDEWMNERNLLAFSAIFKYKIRRTKNNTIKYKI